MGNRIFLTVFAGLYIFFMAQLLMAQPSESPNPPQNCSAMENVFKQADKNADGNLTLEEFIEMHKNRPPMPPGPPEEMPPVRPPRMGREDRPVREGRPAEDRLDRPERPGPPGRGMKVNAEEIFKEADKDKDGKLSLEEFKSVKPPRRPNPPIPPDKPGPPDDRLMPGGQNPRGQKIREWLEEADKDGDGKVSYEEIKSIRPHMTEERFKWADTNSDGFITKEDIRDWAEHAQAKFKEADADNDGKLSRDEVKKLFPNMNDEMFNRKDDDGDGFLTIDELKPRFRRD